MPTALWLLLPELFLAFCALASLAAGAIGLLERYARMVLWSFAGLFVIVAFLVMQSGEGSETGFGGLIQNDAFARYAKGLILCAAFAILMMSERYLTRRNLLWVEFPPLLALSVTGMMVMVSAGDLITLYAGLELQALVLCILTMMRRGNAHAITSGLSFLTVAALSSAFVLVGLSYIYGATGSTGFARIAEATFSPMALAGFALVLGGLAVKIGAAPFHVWLSDVFQGAPLPVTAYFATAPLVAALALFARVVFDGAGLAPHDMQVLLTVMAILSLWAGALAGLVQSSLKRLMACAAVFHTGYALLALADGSTFGVQAMLIYLAISTFTTLGLFAFVLMMERDGTPTVDLDALTGLARYDQVKALALLFVVLSASGMPPLVGFFAKFYVLQAVIEGGLWAPAIAAVAASVVMAVSYLRIIHLVYFGDEAEEPLTDPKTPALMIALVAVAACAVVGSVSLFGLEAAANAAALALFD